LLICFVSAPAGVNLSRLKQILLERDIEFVLPSEVLTHGQTISEKINKLISRSDIFMAVFDDVHDSGNILFELGLAVGLKKQIIILIPPSLSLPSDLSGFLVLRVTQNNLDAVGFSLDQMLAATWKKSKKRVTKRYDDLKNTKKPISNKIYDLKNKLNDLDSRVAGYTLEEFVADLLRESGISVIQQSEKPDTGVDFAIWSDELAAILGNPILIEIKRVIRNQAQALQVTDQLTRYIEKSNSKSAIVLYLEGLPSNQIQNFTNKFNILFFQLGDIVEQLQDNTFADIIRIRRNIIAHGGVE
jgi:hypothetical protein